MPRRTRTAAIIGLGVGQQHARAYGEMGVKVTHYCDFDLEKVLPAANLAKMKKGDANSRRPFFIELVALARRDCGLEVFVAMRAVAERLVRRMPTST